MSHVESLQSAYAAFDSGDIETAFADLADDCVFHGNMSGMPAGGDYRGRDEIVGTWLPELRTYEDSTSEDVRFLDAGDHVVVLGREAATVNGHRIATAFCHVWRFDGQLEEAWVFGDGARTARAMDGALGTSA